MSQKPFELHQDYANRLAKSDCKPESGMKTEEEMRARGILKSTLDMRVRVIIKMKTRKTLRHHEPLST